MFRRIYNHRCTKYKIWRRPLLSVRWPIFSRAEAAKRIASLHGCCAEEAHLNGTYSRLRAVGDTQLGQDVLHMDFDRTHTHRQLVGNLPVGLTLCEQLQHFALARREL